MRFAHAYLKPIRWKIKRRLEESVRVGQELFETPVYAGAVSFFLKSTEPNSILSIRLARFLDSVAFLGPLRDANIFSPAFR